MSLIFGHYGTFNLLCAGQSYEMKLKGLKESNDGDEQLLKVPVTLFVNWFHFFVLLCFTIFGF